MIRRSSAFLLTTIAILLVASVVCQAQQPLLTRHVREAVANGQAVSVGRLPLNQSLHIDIVLALRHQPELENFIQELYDPSSSSYRRFLTPTEFTERFGPSQEDYDALVAFSKANGFTVLRSSRDSRDVQLKGSVAAIEKAFHVTMGLYQHPTENRKFYAPDREPTVDLPFQLWHISGLDNYSIPRPLLQHKEAGVKGNAVKGSCPGSSYCGSDMRAAYYGQTALTGAGQNLGLLEYLGYDIADLNTYYTNVGQTNNVPVVGISTDGSSLNCLNSQGCDDREQILDMTQAIGMAPGLTTLYVYVGSTDTAILGGMVSDKPLPAQLSSSWTWSPADPSTDDPYFQQMATQGQTYFQASGDGGSYRGSAPWPANSQYIQAVGGTDLQTASAGGPWSSETAWVDGGGGWGSNVSIPSWQQLTGVITSQNEGSTTLRNVPDVSAEANFDFYTCADQEACQTGWGGTSFATPMWAGFMALINQQALQNSLPVLGFINPAVYNLGLSGNYDNAFHDITSGSNGFPAVTGYDLATGWGSPNGAGLINALAGPQTPSFTLSAKPNAVTVVQGSTASSTITVNPTDGFTGSVTLSTSTLPSGVTAGFSPNPTTTTSTLTFTASSTATTGTTTITITGVSGNITQTTSVNLTVNTVNSSPAVSLSPTSLTWTKVVVGQTGSAKTVTVSNTGGGTLNISSIAVSGNFALVAAPPKTACGSTLAAGASCIVKVSFTPTQGGTVTGSLSFTDNAPGSPQKVSLSGTGVALVLSTTGLNFGTVAVGSSSASFPVTITNESSSSVTLTGITITGAKADFVITNNTCGSSIAGGGNCSVSVAFKPVTKGLLSATLKIASTGGGSPQSVSLGGNGD